MNLFKKSSKTGMIRECKSQILSRARILMSLQTGETLEIPVGDEWSDARLMDGMFSREVKGYRDNDDSMIIMVDAPRGSLVRPHFHHNTETIMCVKGHARCALNDRELTKGKTWEIPPRLVHSLEFLEDTLLCVMWHPRFDELR